MCYNNKWSKEEKGTDMLKNKVSITKILLMIADVGFVVISAILACLVTSGGRLNFQETTWIWLAMNIVLAVVVLHGLKMYSIVLSTASMIDGIKMVISAVAIGTVNIIFSFITKRNPIGLSVSAAYTVFFFGLSSGARFAKRFLSVFKRTLTVQKCDKKRVMVVGGGEAGLALIKEILTSDKINYKPVCIVDDDEHLQGKHIYDVKVAGSTKDVKEICEKYEVDEIILAMPSVSKKITSVILERCRECNRPVKILPGIYQLVNGQITVSQLRSVDIADLLGREQIRVDLNEIMGYIQGKVVMVTGGGGSIGSELCRQIAVKNPKQLIILDIYENNAYDIEQELKRKYPNLVLLTLIASIRDKKKIDTVFEKYRPDIVFNAAAHKHVPLMETSPNEAVKNNVFGTLNVARAADTYGVKTFVQISTDKAVNPTNIMGATKRICEMIIQTIGKHSKNTNFVAVRFGNVLGSNGSVIPLFKKQIAEGGPVTVTHKDIIRYFMTIPEAVSLVLQAGAYAKGGQIFVLDMGEPVRIYDLAYNLIKLSGLTPNEDIEIKCTGLRPGEKLFEERLMEEEGLQKTENGLISIAKPIPLDEEFFWVRIEQLYKAAYDESEEMKDKVKELVPTYTIDRGDGLALSYLKNQKENSQTA